MNRLVIEVPYSDAGGGGAVDRTARREPGRGAAAGRRRLVPQRTSGNSDRATFCEVREFKVAATAGTLSVSGTNGGISVEGESRGDVHILAKIVANAETDARARQIAASIRLNPTLDQVEATGPRTQNREGWSVSYRLSVPRALNLALRSSNGGISLRDLDSKVEFETTNGGVKLIGGQRRRQGPDDERRRRHRSRRHVLERRRTRCRDDQRWREGGGPGELFRALRGEHQQRRGERRLPGRDPGPPQAATSTRSSDRAARPSACARRMAECG